MGKKFIIGLAIVGLVGLLVFVLASSLKSGKTQPAAASNVQGDETGDRPVESLASIGAITAQNEEELERQRKEYEQKSAEDEAEKAKLQAALDTLGVRLGELQSGFSESIVGVENRIREQLAESSSDDQYAVGQEVNDISDGSLIWITSKYANNSSSASDDSGILGKTRNITNGLLDGTRETLVAAGAGVSGRGRGNQPLRGGSFNIDGDVQDYREPVYTIPVNATLAGSVSLSSIIGRVPVGSNVRFPVRFKVKTGGQNLMANGVELPEVKEAIWAGYAYGDRVLECVRGVIDSVTFVFQDGRIATIPDPSEDANGEGRNRRNAGRAELNELDGLGWISDPKGNCIAGEYISNAPENLSKLFFAGFAAGAADGLAQSQVTLGAGGLSSVLTGNGADFVFGSGASEGLDAWSDYMAERAAEDFDVVYVESGREIVINITNQLEIDYDFAARKVKYFSTSEVSNDLH